MLPPKPQSALPAWRRGLSEYALKRMAKHDKVVDPKLAATSSMRKGVTERPMEKDISKSLELKRAQSLQRGTSVSRLRKGRYDEEQTASADETTSVGRLRTDRLVLPKLPPIMKQKPHDPYGDI